MEESPLVFGLATHTEIAALAVLVVGVVLARLVSVGVGAMLGVVDRRAARFATTDTSMMSPRLIRVARAFVFWLFVVLAVSLSLRILGVGGFSAVLNDVISFTPRLLVAFTIVVAGHLVGLVAAHLVSRLGDDVASDSLGPRMLHGAIVVVAIVLGLQHIDVDISFITRLLLILVAVVGSGLMLAFALGARQHVANLLARRELSRLAIGDRIRVDGLEGTVVDIHSTGVDIATEDGIAAIPAARFAEAAVVRGAVKEDRD